MILPAGIAKRQDTMQTPAHMNRVCLKSRHIAKDCGLKDRLDTRLCKNCHKVGHLAVDCKNEKACNNCRKASHLAKDCKNTLVFNLCNLKGHIARDCEPLLPSGRSLQPQPYMDPSYCSVSRECLVMAICEEHNLNGNFDGLSAYEMNALQDWEWKFMSKYVKAGQIPSKETKSRKVHIVNKANATVETEDTNKIDRKRARGAFGEEFIDERIKDLNEGLKRQSPCYKVEDKDFQGAVC
ncbi:hypothetical protein L7F22_006718 [Adiantum nelumboides]|nr:hypothetical protein [Adiantum nelumboides]